MTLTKIRLEADGNEAADIEKTMNTAADAIHMVLNCSLEQAHMVIEQREDGHLGGRMNLIVHGYRGPGELGG